MVEASKRHDDLASSLECRVFFNLGMSRYVLGSSAVRFGGYGVLQSEGSSDLWNSQKTCFLNNNFPLVTTFYYY